ncbi:MAG: PilZ domain-containing protein [Acidobacteriia bacterium]|nr:PilZ domain-containing protein [Terriglobia bacterium]
MKPATGNRGTPLISVELECLECHQRLWSGLSAGEFRSLTSAWQLARSCSVCGKLTEWTFTETMLGVDQPADFWGWLANAGVRFAPPIAPPQQERRQEPRAEMELPLRIATVGGDEEAVTSENISQSGLCFTSARDYLPGESLLITLKTAGAVAPTVKRGIVVRTSPAGPGLTRYGVRLVD